MFNRGRFNRQRFNLIYAMQADIAWSADLREVFGGYVEIGQVYNKSADLAAAVLSTAQGTPAGWAVGDYSAQMSGRAAGNINYSPPVIALASVLDGYIEGTLDIGIACDMQGKVQALMYLGLDSQYVAVMQAAVRQGLQLGKDYNAPALLMAATMSAQASTIRYAISYITINTPIPPGSTIVIDSNSYTVLQDGENAIDTHKGDWLLLGRNTYDVQVQAIGGVDADIDKQILYMVRWL